MSKALFNIRQQKYKANRIAGMNKYNAARSAKYSESYSRDHADKIEKSVIVGIRDAFEQAGLTDKVIVDHALKGLEANKVIAANIIYGDADEKTNDFIDVPDWANRHKYLNTICEITGMIRHKVEHSGIPKPGETKIYIISDKNGSKNKTERIPNEISL